MLLQDKLTGNLVKILEIEELISPNKMAVSGQLQAGEEEQDPARFKKQDLTFASGESLPRCWMDANYRSN